MTTTMHTPIAGKLKHLHQYDTRPINLNIMRRFGYQILPNLTILESEYISSFLSFSDKESYLTWVAEWKTIYKSLSDESRKFKKLRKKANAEAAGIDPQTACLRVSQLKLELYYLLQIRMAGKGKSHSLWLKSQS